MINWKVRISNKTFWVSAVPAVLLLIQAVLTVFGITINLDDFGAKLLEVVNTLFVVLSIIGVVNYPTTQGIEDSERAMGYSKPYPHD